jgi:hypothetical protein
MVTWRDRVALSCSVCDQHTPGVFLPVLTCAGYGLLFRLRKVPIWTSEGRPLIGGVPGDDACSARAGFFRLFISCACIPGLLLVLMYILPCFTVYRFSVAALS